MAATRKVKRAPPRKGPAPRHLSRGLLDKMLRDLVGRLDGQIRAAEAIATTMRPTGDHTLREVELRRVFGILLENQLRGLRDVQGFARLIICRDEGSAT